MSANKLKSVLKLGASFGDDRHGGAAIIMAFVTPIIIGGLAFGAEVGGWELAKRQVQNAADVAAFAAGTQVRSGEDDEEVLSGVATLVAEESGFKGGAAGVAVEYPPATAPIASDGTDPNGDNSFVYVTLTQSSPRVFTKFFSSTDEVTFSSGALARIENGRPACVLSLHPSASGSVTATGSTSVGLTGCDIASNSISTTAVTVGGSAGVTTNCVSAVGGVSSTAGLTMTECSSPIENAPLTADPYADVAEPSVPASCASGVEKNKFATGNNKTGNPKPTSGGASNLGDAYCGSGTENIQGTTNLSPGVYVLNGGNWRINSTADVSGTGVTFYLTGGATFNINGGAEFDVSAPTSGTYAGILFFFDRDNTGSSTFNGGSDISMVGAIYGAGHNIDFSGNTTAGSAAGECVQVIGSIVTFSGNSTFDTNCSASGTKEIRTAQSIKIVG